MEDMDSHFALLSYTTWNIGDEVQSLAARQFLPRVDVYLERDRIGTEAALLTHPTKAILNSWWIHGTDWPPRGEMLNPLLTSVFLDHKHPITRNAFTTPDSIEFFSANGPVGARDLSTLEFLQEQGLPSYFSGCLTLTLRRDPLVPRQDFILAVDLPLSVVAALRRRTSRPVVVMSTYHEPDLDTSLRFKLAELYLHFYQSAAAVITTRLHAVLPATALETPALLVRTARTFDASRFSGLVDLTRSCSSEQLENDRDVFDLDDPSGNPSAYLAVREELTMRCSRFTGTQPSVIEASQSLGDPTSLRWLAEILGDQMMKARAGREFVDEVRAQRDRSGPFTRVARKLWSHE